MRTVSKNIQILEPPGRISEDNLSCCRYFTCKGMNQRTDVIFYRKLFVTNQDVFWTRVPVFVLPLNRGSGCCERWELPFSSVIWKKENSLSEGSEEIFYPCAKEVSSAAKITEPRHQSVS